MLTSDFGVASEVKMFNFDAPDYSSASINALGVINMTEVDFGSADMTIAPGGSSSTANGPSGDNAVMDDVTVGDMLVYRMQPSVMTDVTAGHIDFSGNETAIRHGSGQGTGFTMNNFAITGADKACINLPSSADAMIFEGTMTNCNTDGESWGGAIVNYPGSTGGMLHVENVTLSLIHI